jgi:hypothetical protein
MSDLALQGRHWQMTDGPIQSFQHALGKQSRRKIKSLQWINVNRWMMIFFDKN